MTFINHDFSTYEQRREAVKRANAATCPTPTGTPAWFAWLRAASEALDSFETAEHAQASQRMRELVHGL